ncbi:RecQ-mediated genome instability protein 1 [Tolypocladium capitatum]|uniref:RecQ-mediated genome instability protein 1 n=1 Tax=Tolypocladium capitatum TaxID=45235 RepID=A0A2K3Q766_9HYPO|nr:RecQ-mediated genome instability protein 1 [Tolypocladium capitatum]
MDLASQLRASLLAQSLPPPSTDFLTTLTTSRSPAPPLPSLLATAKARLLACDLTSSSLLDAALLAALPDAAATTKDATLPRDVQVQVLDVEDLSLSRWEQVEGLEAMERGERTRGREIVRVVAAQDQNGDEGASQTQRTAQTASASTSTSTAAAAAIPAAGPNATHRLVLQDHQGKRIFAVELRRVDRIGVGKTNIGEKMLLRAGTVVARGAVLLTPETCVLLGGKIEAWHDSWVQGRLARLKEAVGSHRPR